jgi:chromate reductase, NAD(P)H dehydrogenase (quinone)
MHWKGSVPGRPYAPGFSIVYLEAVKGSVYDFYMNRQKTDKIKILGISGSLRQSSSACAVLRQVGILVPDHAELNIYDKLEKIPAFDDGRLILVPVADFIKRISEADAVFFCIPEYAFGVPGALKNALDWTVSSTAFSNKPVALITAATVGEKAHAALSLTLTAIGAKISEQTKLLVPNIRSKLNENGEVKDADTLNAIKSVIQALLVAVESGQSHE